MPEQTQQKPDQETKGYKQSVRPTTLADVIAAQTKNILDAFQTDSAPVKQNSLIHARNELRQWYDAQTPEDRKEFARATRKIMENFQNVCAQLYHEMIALTMRDS